MSGAVSDKPEAFNPPPAGEFLGHPKALWNLFGSEFWERFMYYGMRAMLAVHVAAAFFSHLGPGADAQASVTYGGFTSLVYMTGILGGYVADRILGYQRSIMLGGVLTAIGSYMLMAPDLTTFVMGLAVIVVGNGLFKPNISTMVGKLYAPGDARRDSGFTIFYMGINAGALVAPIICSAWIGANYGYRFFAAGTGMLLGLVVFQALKAWLGHVGTAPAGREGMGNVGKVLVGALLLAVPAYFLLDMGWQNAFAERFAADGVFGMLLRKLGILGMLLVVMMVGLAAYFITSGIRSGEKQQLHRYIAMLILFAANILFWALFEQAGASLNFLAQDHVNAPFHFTLFQSANPLFIVLLAPVFAMMWPWLDKMNMNPSIPRKFAIALIGMAAGFALLVFALKNFLGPDDRIGWYWLAGLYLIHTMAELCLSPIGLSMVTKLAAPKNVGLSMGGWFLATAVANYLAGRISAIASGGGGHGEAASSLAQYSQTFTMLIWAGLIVGGIYFLFAPLINKLMHGVK